MRELPAEAWRRIEQTVAVRDTDPLPKVEGAGAVLVEGGVEVQVMHNGLRVLAGSYYGEWMTEVIEQLRGHHEPQEEVVFAALVERLNGEAAPAMAELGAYWSYYGMWFLRALEDARAVLVEPDPRHLDVARRHLTLNGLNARTVWASVGSGGVPATWFPAESDGVARLTPHVTLEDVLDDAELERADLVLCDVQGAETELLQASDALLRAGRVRFLLVSTHHHSISGDPLTHQRCLRLLEDAGAHVIAEHTVAESCSGDGMIAVSFDPRDAGFTVPVSRVRARDSLFGELEHDLARAYGAPPVDHEEPAADR